MGFGYRFFKLNSTDSTGTADDWKFERTDSPTLLEEGSEVVLGADSEEGLCPEARSAVGSEADGVGSGWVWEAGSPLAAGSSLRIRMPITTLLARHRLEMGGAREDRLGVGSLVGL